MDSIPRTHKDIEAQIREIQSKKKELLNTASEKEQVALGKTTGFYDQDIYDSSNNKFDGYVTSIATNDEIEDYDPFADKRLPTIVDREEKDYDPFADRRRPTADREASFYTAAS
ncbi:splicing factor 3B subunit 1 [Temnothorax longispinosus]